MREFNTSVKYPTFDNIEALCALGMDPNLADEQLFDGDGTAFNAVLNSLLTSAESDGWDVAESQWGSYGTAPSIERRVLSNWPQHELYVACAEDMFGAKEREYESFKEQVGAFLVEWGAQGGTAVHAHTVVKLWTLGFSVEKVRVDKCTVVGACGG